MLGLLNCSSTKRVGRLSTTATPVANKTFTYAHFYVDTFEYDVPYTFGPHQVTRFHRT